jgi:DNA polymerase III alpha subunit
MGRSSLDKVRTEYSFGQVFGQLNKVIAACTSDKILICDRNTWGHVPFFEACKKAGKMPLLGVEIGVVSDLFTSKSKTPDMWASFIARNNEGLEELYQLVATSNKFKYYQPRISFDDLHGVSKNISIIVQNSAHTARVSTIKNLWLEASPASYRVSMLAAAKHGLPLITVSDNYYPRESDRIAYEVFSRFPENKTTPMYILSPSEMRRAMPGLPEAAFEKAWDKLTKGIDVQLPKAENVRVTSKKTMEQLCAIGAKQRGINLKDKVYAARLKRELDLIKSKGFQDYFFLVADLCVEAKKVMLVGPARGSSAGSLACYLMGITEVDPIPHGLMFERFIDITRADLPDIDIDFPDKDWCFKYLGNKYGVDNVAHIGTVLRYQAKSAIADVGKALKVPEWELKDVKGAVIERSGGDARAAFCIRDTFESLDIGKKLIQNYPNMIIAADLEEHAKSSGIHAAGIIVCNDAVSKYCGLTEEGVACIDKKDAEKINILKIDALGLRTLLILQDVLEQIGEKNEFIYTLPLDDESAFKVLNDGRFAGIFQFEGFALKSLTKQMGVREFNDIVSITSLARPGPLHCGAANDFVGRRSGRDEVKHMHPALEPYTRDTLGVIIYQEQVMAICRNVGEFSWEDTSSIRKAMSKSLGEEYFNKYIEKFQVGAAKLGIKKAEALEIWNTMCTFGSWAFNLSHGVSYGLVSYWCCWMKAHYPLEFAAATLRNLKDEDQAVKMLRELVKEGFEYIPFDPKLSDINWSVQDGKLVGGWLGVKGVGESKAKLLKAKMEEGLPLTAAEQKFAYSPVVLWADIFECERRFGHYYADYEANGLSMPVSQIVDVNTDGEYIIICKLKEKNLRDMNEYGSVAKRGGKIVKNNNLWLNMSVEDDTDSILATVPRGIYEELGKPIVESGKIGDWYMFRGKLQGGWRKLIIDKVKRLT